MTYAGVILPWVDGVCSYLIPAWATARVIDGKCLTFQWPTPAMFSAYTLTMFVLHFVLPPAFFFFAYYRIIGVIRRQQRIVAPNVDTMASTSATGGSQAASRTGHGQMKHKRQMNVVRTMSIIVLCFCICYLPYNVFPSLSFHHSFLITITTLHFLSLLMSCHFDSPHLSFFLRIMRHLTCLKYALL